MGFIAQQQQAKEEWVQEKQMIQQSVTSQSTENNQSFTNQQYQQQQIIEQSGNQHQKIVQLPTTTYKTSTETVKSRQQLEKERDEIIQQTIKRYQVESKGLTERLKHEEEERLSLLKEEQNRADREAEARQVVMKRGEEERARKVKEEKERYKQMEVERRKRLDDQKQMFDKNKVMTERKAMEVKEKQELKKQDDLQLQEQQKQVSLEKLNKQKLEQESVSSIGQVARRTDDMHGLGFGQVKTGHVVTKKISFLQKASSVEPERAVTESPAPKKRMVRFAG